MNMYAFVFKLIIIILLFFSPNSSQFQETFFYENMPTTRQQCLPFAPIEHHAATGRLLSSFIQWLIIFLLYKETKWFTSLDTIPFC